MKKIAHKNKYFNFINTFKTDGENTTELYSWEERERGSDVLRVLYIANPYGAVVAH